MSGIKHEIEVEVVLVVTTTEDDIVDALVRSGIVAGELIGEALIESVQVLWPEAIGP